MTTISFLGEQSQFLLFLLWCFYFRNDTCIDTNHWRITKLLQRKQKLISNLYSDG